VEPRIRGDNPPLTTTLAYRRLGRDNTAYFYGFIVATTLVGVLTLLYFLTGFNVFVGVPLMIALVVAAIFGFGQNRTARELAVIPPIVPLYAYNTNFMVTFADRTLADITVHFQIPRDRGPQTKDYTGAEHPSEFMEQLNRVTENILTPFCLRCPKLPEESVVEEQLHKALVTFQNENCIPVLKVNVPIILPVEPPPKPKAVYV
jgi:hypothetical protein